MKIEAFSEFMDRLDWEDIDNLGIVYATFITQSQYLLHFRKLGCYEIEGFFVCVERLTLGVYGLSCYLFDNLV